MYVALASQKRYMSLYMTNVYSDASVEAWFTERYRATGKRLDMGKSCVRFRRLDDLPLDLVGEVVGRTPVADFVELYRASRSGRALGVGGLSNRRECGPRSRRQARRCAGGAGA